MRIQKVEIKGRFQGIEGLTIDLGDVPSKIIALVGPNGCGKSSVFDFFEGYQAIKLRKHNISLGSNFEESWLKFRQTNSESNIQFQNDKNYDNKTFYIRSPYRYVQNLNVTNLAAVPSPAEDQDRPGNMRLMDSRLLNNFSLIQGWLLRSVNNVEGGDLEVGRKLIGRFNKHIENILDIRLNDLGNIPESRGQLYFKRKNSSAEISYNFLSAGEKEIIDILLDLILKIETYDNTVFCIDEPELHINTATQKMLLYEIDKIIPETCQLWIATHSIGFLRAMQEELNDKTQIIDFGEFPSPGTCLKPIEKNSASWRKLFHVAIDDLASLIAPETLIYCEGKIRDTEKMDALVYDVIFNVLKPSTLFINAGGSDEMEKYRAVTLDILSNSAFPSSSLYVLKDMDERTEEGRSRELKQDSSIRMLKRREIENYLFDWKVVSKAYPNVNEAQYRDTFSQIDTITGNMKSKFGKLKDLCDEHNREEFIKKLAQKINSEENPEIFNELNEIIFMQNNEDKTKQNSE